MAVPILESLIVVAAVQVLYLTVHCCQHSIIICDNIDIFIVVNFADVVVVVVVVVVIGVAFNHRRKHLLPFLARVAT